MEEQFPNVETVAVRIHSVLSVDRYGKPLIDKDSGEEQRAVVIVFEWEEAWLSQHGTAKYYLKSQIPNDLQGGQTRWCRIIRQSIRTKPAVKPEDKFPRDGSRKEHWDYSIAEWDVDREPQQEGATPQPVAQQPVAQQPVATQYKAQEEKIPENQMKIMRQSALKCASWIVVPTVAEMGIETSANKSMEIANLFLDYVITGEIPKSKEIKGTDSLDGVVPDMSQDIDEEWN